MYRENSYYDRSNRNRKIFIKGILCIVGIVVLTFIAFTYRNHKLKEGKAPFVRAGEVHPVLELLGEIQNTSIEWDNILREEYMTYADVIQIMEKFPIEDTSILKDYKKEEWYIGLSDWYLILEQLVFLYGEDKIHYEEHTILGLSEQVTNEDGIRIPEGTVLTEKGVYTNRYWNIDAFLFSNVEVLCHENEILAINDHTSRYGEIENVYLADVTDGIIHLFWNHYHMYYPQEITDWAAEIIFTDEVSRKIVDIAMAEGNIILTKEKNEYVHGKLLQVSEDTIEIEGHGIYPIDEEMSVYRLYSELAVMGKQDLRIGYAFTDFVINDGEVAACLMMKEENMDYIRVLLKNSNLEGRYHDSFAAFCSQNCEMITYQDGIEKSRKTFLQGERIVIEPTDIALELERIKIVPSVLSAKITVESITRNQGQPSYFGTLEVRREEEGLLVVNEVLLEDYLCTVVPSEMPASYPNEALMSQAVCARTYAYGKMLQSGLPDLGAHVDDSAGFQVYNNISEQAATTEAVRATHNTIAVFDEEPIGTYYYSTSCGRGSDSSVWHGGGSVPSYLVSKVIGRDETVVDLTQEENFREWITNINESHYESEEGWYRWNYQVKEVNTQHMENVLKARYASNPNLILAENEEGEFVSKEINDLGELQDIRIMKRLTGGIADELLLTFENETIKVLSELNIRYVLSDGVTKVIRQTKDEVDASSMLPSAFIIIDPVKMGDEITGYTIIGGGFGHGVGMSQNGAKNMAKAGMSYEEIMTFFYPGIELKTLQFEE